MQVFQGANQEHVLDCLNWCSWCWYHCENSHCMVRDFSPHFCPMQPVQHPSFHLPEEWVSLSCGRGWLKIASCFLSKLSNHAKYKARVMGRKKLILYAGTKTVPESWLYVWKSEEECVNLTIYSQSVCILDPFASLAAWDIPWLFLKACRVAGCYAKPECYRKLFQEALSIRRWP